MGFALAEAAIEAGARVTLITGPVNLPTPDRVSRIDVVSARDMLAACEAAIPCDLFIASAAVADYRPEVVAPHKLKKDPSTGDGLLLQMVRNPDIPPPSLPARIARSVLALPQKLNTCSITLHASSRTRTLI